VHERVGDELQRRPKLTQFPYSRNSGCIDSRSAIALALAMPRQIAWQAAQKEYSRRAAAISLIITNGIVVTWTAIDRSESRRGGDQRRADIVAVDTPAAIASRYSTQTWMPRQGGDARRSAHAW
jgi:hypothetical protein